MVVVVTMDEGREVGGLDDRERKDALHSRDLIGWSGLERRSSAAEIRDAESEFRRCEDNHSMETERSAEDRHCSAATAIPGTRGKDGAYIPPTVPPEWEMYPPPPF
jgi:hypothetical protein